MLPHLKKGYCLERQYADYSNGQYFTAQIPHTASYATANVQVTRPTRVGDVVKKHQMCKSPPTQSLLLCLDLQKMKIIPPPGTGNSLYGWVSGSVT
ncbi:hypothetical protein CHUAL_006664 [Chamberlinius hualienensis]